MKPGNDFGRAGLRLFAAGSEMCVSYSGSSPKRLRSNGGSCVVQPLESFLSRLPAPHPVQKIGAPSARYGRSALQRCR